MSKKFIQDKKRTRKGLQERREKILKAAVEVFTEKGLNGATINDIAERAGVGKGTIYRRTGKKKDIIELLIKTAARLLTDNIKTEIKKRTDPVLQFKEAVYALCDLYEKNLNLLVLFMVPEIIPLEMKTTAGAEEYAEDETKSVFQLVGGILQKAIKNGQLRSVNPYIVGKGLCYFLNPLFYKYLRFKADFTKGEIAQLVIDLFLDGLRKRK